MIEYLANNYQAIMMCLMAAVVILVLFIFILTCFNGPKETDKKETPKTITRMPKYYIGAKVKIRGHVVNERCLGWREFQDHLDDEFEVTGIFNTVDRGINYRIYCNKKIGPTVGVIFDQVVPEHYLYWACDECVELYADNEVYSVIRLPHPCDY